MFETTKERASRELEHVRSGIAALAPPVVSPIEEQQPRTESIAVPPQPNRSADASTQPALNASSFFTLLKSTADAAQKTVAPALKELSKAEDAADAYLNKWGASFSQMLKDAVSIAPPEESQLLNVRHSGVLFDSSKEKGSKYLVFCFFYANHCGIELASTRCSKTYTKITKHLSTSLMKHLLPPGNKLSQRRSIPMKSPYYSIDFPRSGRKWTV